MQHTGQTACKLSSTHFHSKTLSTQHRTREQKRLLIALAVTLTMMLIEVFGAIFSNSLSLLSDAGHMMMHVFTLLVSFFAIGISKLAPTPEKSFGFFRAEILAAFFNGLTLILISVYILYQAFFRLFNPEPIATKQMLIIAVMGLVVNLATALILKDVSHENLNIKSAFFHMLGDTFSSVGVVLAALIIGATGWVVLDPLVSMGIAALILYWAYKLIRMAGHVLLEARPKHLSHDEIVENMKVQCPVIRGVHDVHVWEITSQMYAMTAHIVVDDMSVRETSNLTNQINKKLNESFKIAHTNFQFES